MIADLTEIEVMMSESNMNMNSFVNIPLMSWDPQTMSEPLILAVRKRPILWNFKLKTNKVRPQKDNAWQSVCDELGWPREDYQTIEKKWSNLRSTYVRHRQKRLITPPSGSGSSIYLITWPYFHMMDEFLSGPDPHQTP